MTQGLSVFRWPSSVFRLILVCFFGARTLRRIAPYVLAGIGETSTHPLLPDGVANQVEDDSWLTTWLIPIISWMALMGILIAFLVIR
jgi:hypothetical protein